MRWWTPRSISWGASRGSWRWIMGGGEGKETVELAARGLRPVSLDLSHRQLARARALIRAQNPGAPVYFIQANAEELPFADGSFRVVYGKAILHHLDLDLAAGEITRVMRADGRAAFAEPLADHPLIGLGRRLTPRLRTRDERPLAADEMERFAERFRPARIRSLFPDDAAGVTVAAAARRRARLPLGARPVEPPGRPAVSAVSRSAQVRVVWYGQIPQVDE